VSSGHVTAGGAAAIPATPRSIAGGGWFHPFIERAKWSVGNDRSSCDAAGTLLGWQQPLGMAFIP